MRAALALATVLLAAATLPGLAGEGPRGARPRLCPEDAPPGVRLPDRPGCGTGPAAPVKAGHPPGTIEIAPGTTVRVGGRARFDYDVRR